MDKSFLNAVDSACDVALASLGFESPRRGNPLLKLNGDFYGWIGLNRRNTKQELQVNPFVGVHCVPMMRLWYEIDGELGNRKYVVGATATTAVHLGELAPDVRVFVFNDLAKIEAEARRLAAVVADVGIPWMQSHSSIEAILPLLKERESMLGGFPERIAIALFLLKRREEALAYLDAKLAEYGDVPARPQVAEAWLKFSERFRRHMQSRV